MVKERIVYTGGRHVIVCDGKKHWCITQDGTRTPDGSCWCKKES